MPLLRERLVSWTSAAGAYDLAVILLSCVAAAFAVRFQVIVSLLVFLQQHAPFEGNAALAIMVAFPVSASIIAFRRRRQLRRELAQRQLLEGQLQHQAFYDALTGLANRALFLDRLTHALARGGRRHEGVAVLFLDLDDFKVINDSLGHAAGDALLCFVADRLSHRVRSVDTVARFGGDEFTVLLEHVADAATAQAIAAQLLAELRLPLVLAGHSLVVSASAGVAFSNGDDGLVSEEALLQAADTALYQAKAAGKGGAVLFDAAMQQRATQRLGMESALHRALEQQEFEVYYQPQMDTESSAIVGVEALVRWHHPDRGLVSPSEFIPLAEQTGLIVPLGQWVLETACRQTREWLELHGEHPFVLSVNLSPRQMKQPDLVEQVSATLAASGLEADRLCLEITESSLMEDVDLALRTLESLRGLGVHLAVDDFGTGYSSLSYLQRFPVETVKIDQSFVLALSEDPGANTIVRSVTTLAHLLGMTVIAEGVETAAQRAVIQDATCDIIQGFYFGRPQPVEAITDLLKAKRTETPAGIEHAA